MVMLTRKMLRDVWKSKTSFLAIFLLMLMGCYIFSGISSEYQGMQKSLDTFMKECDMADATVMAESFPKHYSQDIQTQEVMSLSAYFQNNDNTSLDVHIIKENHISKLKIMEGKSFDTTSDGVWLDERFAKAHHLQVNDTITFTIQNKPITKQILALVLTPEHIYQVKDNAMVADHIHNGFLYMNTSHAPFTFTPNKVFVKSDREDLKDALLKDFDGRNAYITMRKDNPNYSMLQDEIHQHKELGMIFSITFLSIALLVSITTIHRLLNQQTSIIAILKALGFHKTRLYLHYAAHGTLISFCGAMIGCILGTLTFSSITYPFMNAIYTLPKLSASPILFTYALPWLCACLSLMISLCITHQHLRYPAAMILSNRHTKRMHAIHLPKIFHHASFITLWNIKDITRNPIRSIMSIFGVIGCTALLIGAFGMYTTMTHLTTWSFEKLQTYDCKVNGTFDQDTITKLQQAMDGDEVMHTYIDIKTNGKTDQLLLTALSNTRYQHLATDTDTFIHLTNGIAISKNIADQYHLKQGDVLTWKPSSISSWQTNRIEAILRTPMEQGVTIMKSQMLKQHLPYQANTIIGQVPSKAYLQSSQITSIQYRDDMEKNLETMMDATMMMISVFVIAAVLLGSVILYNLGTLSYMERYHELATLKVLGFQSTALRKIMIQQNFWLTFIGICLGIFAGYWLLNFMLGTVQNSMDVILYLPFYVVILACSGTLLLSIFIIFMVSRKVTCIDMVSSLKSED